MQKLTHIHLKMYLTLLRKPGYVVSELCQNSIHQVRKKYTYKYIFIFKLKKLTNLLFFQTLHRRQTKNVAFSSFNQKSYACEWQTK